MEYVHHLGRAPERVHPVDVDGEVSGLEALADHLGLLRLPDDAFLPRLGAQDTAGGNGQHGGQKG